MDVTKLTPAEMLDKVAEGNKRLAEMPGSDFQRMRKVLNLSRKQVSDACGISTATIYAYEHEKRQISKAIIMMLWATLGSVALVSDYYLAIYSELIFPE